MGSPRNHTLLGWLVLVLTVAAAALVVLAVVAYYAWGVRWVSTASAADLRPGELELLTRVVAAESRGESDRGQRAIAWVAINRLDEPETFGRTLTRVLLAPDQFAKPLPLGDTSPAYWRAMLATTRALLGEGGDPSLSSTHFFRTDMRPWPAWAKHMQVRAVIGKHTFLREID